jgi:hypothetical protein
MSRLIFTAGLGLAALCVTSATSFADQSYLCAINEVYECVGIAGCKRVSPQGANLAGVMVLDVKKREVRLAPLGGKPRADNVESITVTDEAILLYGMGMRKVDRTWSAVIALKTGNFSGGISTLRSSFAWSGTCSSNPDASDKQ